MQSYTGTIRIFPNWTLEKDAEFKNLRAVGGFLVSGKLKNGKVEEIQLTSEAGGVLKMILPWENGRMESSSGGKKTLLIPRIDIQTDKGEQLIFKHL
jgi:hypothetical protein